jgi:uncharacterized protein YjgD (DUF1641 family)
MSSVETPPAQDPVLASLERLHARLDRMDARIDALVHAVPGHMAMVVDTLDDLADRVGETGVPLHARVTNLVALADHLTSPGMVALVDALETRLPALTRVLESGLLDDGSTDTAIVTGRALADTARAGAPPAGPLALLGALNDPDTQRALGFFLAFAKRLGTQLPASHLVPPR